MKRVTRRSQLSNYHTLKLIFPAQSYFPTEILNGFKRFCNQYAFNYKVINDVGIEPIESGEVFINLKEDDLVTLLERILALNLTVGKDVGVISYNETPIKKILLNGITTISTDFKYMGIMAAKMVTGNLKQHVEIPFHYTHRSSL
jgi:DNA-binding LacI/PurR family transcriptional regulator